MLRLFLIITEFPSSGAFRKSPDVTKRIFSFTWYVAMVSGSDFLLAWFQDLHILGSEPGAGASQVWKRAARKLSIQSGPSPPHGKFKYPGIRCNGMDSFHRCIWNLRIIYGCGDNCKREIFNPWSTRKLVLCSTLRASPPCDKLPMSKYCV